MVQSCLFRRRNVQSPIFLCAGRLERHIIFFFRGLSFSVSTARKPWDFPQIHTILAPPTLRHDDPDNGFSFPLLALSKTQSRANQKRPPAGAAAGVAIAGFFNLSLFFALWWPPVCFKLFPVFLSASLYTNPSSPLPASLNCLIKATTKIWHWITSANIMLFTHLVHYTSPYPMSTLSPLSGFGGRDHTLLFVCSTSRNGTSFLVDH